MSALLLLLACGVSDGPGATPNSAASTSITSSTGGMPLRFTHTASSPKSMSLHNGGVRIQEAPHPRDANHRAVDLWFWPGPTAATWTRTFDAPTWTRRSDSVTIAELEIGTDRVVLRCVNLEGPADTAWCDEVLGSYEVERTLEPADPRRWADEPIAEPFVARGVASDADVQSHTFTWKGGSGPDRGGAQLYWRDDASLPPERVLSFHWQTTPQVDGEPVSVRLGDLVEVEPTTATEVSGQATVHGGVLRVGCTALVPVPVEDESWCRDALSQIQLEAGQG